MLLKRKVSGLLATVAMLAGGHLAVAEVVSPYVNFRVNTDFERHIGKISDGILFSPDESRVVFGGIADSSAKEELFSASLTGGSQVKLNVPTQSWIEDYEVKISPDSSWVVYIAQPDVFGVEALFSVPITGGSSNQLSPQYSSPYDLTMGIVRDFVISSDSTTVYHLAYSDPGTHQNGVFKVPVGGGTPVDISGNIGVKYYYDLVLADGQNKLLVLGSDRANYAELYSLDLTTNSAVRLHDEPVAEGGVDHSFYLPQVTSDETTVIFRGDLETNGYYQLYVSSVAGGGATNLLSDLGSGARVGRFALSPDETTVVFKGGNDSSTATRLFSVPITGGTVTELSGAMVSGGSVSDFVISPDGTTVCYQADQDTVDQLEIYRVPITGGTAVKVNHALPSDDSLYSTCFFSADSSTIVYSVNIGFYVYSDAIWKAPVDGSSAPVEITPSIPNMKYAEAVCSLANENAVVAAVELTDDSQEYWKINLSDNSVVRLSDDANQGFDADYLQLSPFDDSVLYIGLQSDDAGESLYLTNSSGTSTTRINDDLPIGGDINSFLVMPNANEVVYLAKRTDSDNYNLFHKPIVGGSETMVNDVLPETGGVVWDSYKIAPDGQSVAYLARDEASAKRLYISPIEGGSNVQLSGTIGEGLNLTSYYEFSPDSSYIVFPASDSSGDWKELYSISTEGGTPNKLVEITDEYGLIAFKGFSITSDSQKVIFQADWDSPLTELYSIPISGGTPVCLNDTLDTNQRIEGFSLTPDGQKVAYIGNQLSDTGSNLYVVPVDGGTPLRLNPALDSGENVASTGLYGPTISPNGQYVAYWSNHESSDYREPFVVPIQGGASLKTVPNSTSGNILYAGLFEFSPDSSRVFTTFNLNGTGYESLYSVPVSGGTPVDVAGQTLGWVTGLKISPTGEYALVSSVLGAQEDYAFYSVDLLSGAVRELARNPSFEVGVDLSPDGSCIFAATSETVSDDYLLRKIALDGTEEAEMTPDSLGFSRYAYSLVDDVTFSSNSQYVLYLANQGTGGKHLFATGDDTQVEPELGAELWNFYE